MTNAVGFGRPKKTGFGGVRKMETPPPIDFLEEYNRQQEENAAAQETARAQNPYSQAGRQQFEQRRAAANPTFLQRILPGLFPAPRQTPFVPVSQLVRAAQERGTLPVTEAAAEESVVPGMTKAEYAAQIAAMFGLGGTSGVGGGGGRLDLSAYRAALTDQANQVNAQIQAMYRALGDEAAANLGRVQEVYGGAQTGVGDVYNSATQNVQQAFGSAQQQAADQLARLGIEAAAPTVIDPMALSRAQAVAGLEQGRAGGQAALGRYGATAKDFASQMAQVAQQQSTEMNAAILASLQNRLMDTLAQEAASAGGGGGGGGRPSMSVRDQIALQEFINEGYNTDVLGLPSSEQQQQMAAQDRWALEQQARLNNDAAQLALSFAGNNPTQEEWTAALDLARRTLTGQSFTG